MSNKEPFTNWFRHATGNAPYLFQIRFACDTTLPCFFEVTTTIETSHSCLNPTPHQKENTNG